MKLRAWRDRVADIAIDAIVYSLQLIGAAWLGVRLLYARLRGFFRTPNG